MDKRTPWIVKYRPKHIDEVVDQDHAKKEILEWLNNWPNVDKKALLLYGPAGTGKTSLIEAIANDLGYELIELNASDNRRKEDIDRIVVKAITTRSLISSSKKIILLDEIDGIATKEDAGGVEAVIKLIESTSIPIIAIANDPWDQKLRPLRELCKLIQFKKLTKTNMREHLFKICSNEGIECDKEAIEYIIDRSEGDLRAAINDLEAVSIGKTRITLNDVKILLRPRDKEHDPFETLRTLFSANYVWQAKSVLNQSQIDHEQLKLWLEENIPNQFQNIEDIVRAYDALSRADIYLGRIIRSGDWDLLTYAIELMTAGVSFAAKVSPRDKYRWVKYSFPQRLILMNKAKEVRSTLEDLSKLIASRLHISSSTAKSCVIPLLRVIFITNPQQAAKIAINIGLSEKMVEILGGINKSQIIEYYRQYKKQFQDKIVDGTKKNSYPNIGNNKKKAENSKNLLSFTKK